MWRTPIRYLARTKPPFFSLTVCARQLAGGGVVGQVLGMPEEASAVAGPRFVFLSRAVANQHGDVIGENVTWMVVSPNSRPLGRAADWFADYDECRNAALPLRERAAELRIVISIAHGQWQWRGELAGRSVAVSTRLYLRQHECDYNSRRFLEALPDAQIIAGVRTVRNGSPAW